MKNKLILLILFFFTILNSLFAQHGISENYPFKTGNIFIFKKYSYTGPVTDSIYIRSLIIKDTLIFSRKYYLINNYYGYVNKMWRVDTLSGNLLMFDSSNTCPQYGYEIQYDSLWASLGDTSAGCGSERLGCADTSNYTIFNISYQSKRFYKLISYYHGSTSVNRIYARNFGIVYTGFSVWAPGGFGGTTYNLKGCVIDGVVYGDTSSLIGITAIGNKVPDKTALGQNYPNPFNPITNIKIQIEKMAYVEVIVYDMRGKKIIKLVNEKMQAGIYSVDFTGKELASGVYFYSLFADGKLIDTKKMILLK